MFSEWRINFSLFWIVWESCHSNSWWHMGNWKALNLESLTNSRGKFRIIASDTVFIADLKVILLRGFYFMWVSFWFLCSLDSVTVIHRHVRRKLFQLSCLRGVINYSLWKLYSVLPWVAVWISEITLTRFSACNSFNSQDFHTSFKRSIWGTSGRSKGPIKHSRIESHKSYTTSD